MIFDKAIRFRTLLGAAACIGVFAAVQGTSSAVAATIDLTFTGSVVAGVDAQGQFGGGDLTGDSYVATYQFDSSRGELKDSAPNGESLIGDYLRGDSDPLVSANITVYDGSVDVGSVSFTPTANFESQLATFTTFKPGELNAQALYFGSAGSMVLDNAMISDATPSSLFTKTSFDGSTAGFGDSVMEMFSDTGAQIQSIYLSPTHASFGDFAVSSAPEPGAWSLIIAGVGAIGLFLRRAAGVGRRQRAALA